MTPTVDWIAKFPVRTGLDQLGMRLASEAQYTRLVDYTTTVTWHPRYYSFLAWATRKAFLVTREGDGVHKNQWKRMVRQLDYLVAAATLAGSVDAVAIIGSDKIRPRVHGMEVGGPALVIADDHVGAGEGTGSLLVYGGPMAVLGLMAQKDGVSGPTGLGVGLADAFERCVAAAGVSSVGALGEGMTLTRDELERLAARCGLDQLNSMATTFPEVASERNLLRDRILDWGRFDDPQRPEGRWRIQSIGLVLACHQLMAGGETTRATFREAILTGGVRGHGPLALAPGFADVLGYWKLYQVHANVVFALESLLALALQALRDHEPRRVVPRTTTLDDLDRLIRFDGAGVWDQRLCDVVEALEAQVGVGWTVADAEPAIDVRLRGRRRDSGFRDRGAAAGDAARLLLWSLARLRTLGDDVKASWLGRAAPWRRSPAGLVAHVEGAVASGATTGEYLRTVIDELVLRQHTSNVYRKLADQQGRSTALFNTEGAGLEFVEHHYPGTTNPRFDNAATYLADLGYLGGDPYVLTDDGEQLLRQVSSRCAQ